jgi:hypothetical protein
MPRIRTIKPDFWADMRLARDLSRDQRLFYIGLWNQADDVGRFLAHPRRLVGAIFPYDEDLGPSFASEALSLLASTGRLVLYTVNDEPYGQLNNFNKHQKISHPTATKIPGPDGSVNPPGILPESSRQEEEEERIGKGKEVEEEPKPDVEDVISEVIRTANKGMIDNPLLANAKPIEVTGPSRQIVADWLLAGIAAETLRLVVYDRARAYQPSGRHRQISSLRYFDSAVKDEWEAVQSKAAPTPAGQLQKVRVPPGSPAAQVREELPRAGGKRVGTLRHPTTDEEALDQKKREEQRRVDAWKAENGPAAQQIWEEVGREASEVGIDALGQKHFDAYMESRFRRRIIDGFLTPKLASA